MNSIPHLPTFINTAAIIVTYWPDDGFADRLKKICCQVGCVYIVDNTPSSRAIDLLGIDFLTNTNIEIVKNNKNIGLAAGLNQGIERALASKFQWVLMLDQDTDIDTDALQNLSAIYDSFPDKKVLGIIGANARMPPSSRLMEEGEGGNNLFMEKKVVITSGSLMPGVIFLKMGPFREDFFIEGIDLEYCLRLRGTGLKIICSRKPLMTHAAGCMEEARFFGKRINLTQHAPWRYQLMVRNIFIIFRSYGLSEPLWVAKSILNLSKMVIKIFLYENDREKKLAAIFIGLLEGIGLKRRKIPLN